MSVAFLRVFCYKSATLIEWRMVPFFGRPTMAVALTKPWDAAVEKNMRDFYQTLSEKDRRRFAAVQARQFGHGGVRYTAEVLGCSRRTIERGFAELDDLPHDPAAGQVRRPGAGRKKKSCPTPPRTESEVGVGDPYGRRSRRRHPCVYRSVSSPDFPHDGQEGHTDLCRCASALDGGQDLRWRKIAKDLAGGYSPDRDTQFERIGELIAEYEAAGNPYFSIVTKAEEHLGKLFRAGRVRSAHAFHAFDHDFPCWADGVLIPHGIYDRVRNRGHINLGLSHDTSQFACDSFRLYWNRIGKPCYPKATSILWLCDCGGSNAANTYIFKHDLQELVDQIGVEIRVAHYPSYGSKYNLIERRFFPHLTRACQGMLFDSLE